jgi:hypothetical protein
MRASDVALLCAVASDCGDGQGDDASRDGSLLVRSAWATLGLSADDVAVLERRMKDAAAASDGEQPVGDTDAESAGGLIGTLSGDLLSEASRAIPNATRSNATRGARPFQQRARGGSKGGEGSSSWHDGGGGGKDGGDDGKQGSSASWLRSPTAGETKFDRNLATGNGLGIDSHQRHNVGSKDGGGGLQEHPALRSSSALLSISAARARGAVHNGEGQNMPNALSQSLTSTAGARRSNTMMADGGGGGGGGGGGVVGGGGGGGGGEGGETTLEGRGAWTAQAVPSVWPPIPPSSASASAASAAAMGTATAATNALHLNTIQAAWTGQLEALDKRLGARLFLLENRVRALELALPLTH